MQFPDAYPDTLTDPFPVAVEIGDTNYYNGSVLTPETPEKTCKVEKMI